jgi:hypothetical protein
MQVSDIWTDICMEALTGVPSSQRNDALNGCANGSMGIAGA